MKKLFSGRFHGIPMAVFAVVLILALSAGVVFAAVEAYELWSGTAEVTVGEPITIWWGTSEGSKAHTVSIGDTWEYTFGNLYPGDCHNSTWFRVHSASPSGLLIEGTVTVDGGLTATLSPDNFTISNSADCNVNLSVCADGALSPVTATCNVTFTRQSPVP